MTHNEEQVPCKLTVGDKEIEQVSEFKYLGSTLTDDGRSNKEIKIRIQIAKTMFTNMRNVFNSMKIKFHRRKRALNTYIFSILLYGCES